MIEGHVVQSRLIGMHDVDPDEQDGKFCWKKFSSKVGLVLSGGIEVSSLAHVIWSCCSCHPHLTAFEEQK